MRKGERRPIVGPDGVPTWHLKTPEGFQPYRRVEVKQHEKLDVCGFAWSPDEEAAHA